MQRIDIEWESKDTHKYTGVARLDEFRWSRPFYLITYQIAGSQPTNPIEIYKKEGQWAEKDPVRLSVNDGYLIAEIGAAIDALVG